MYTTRLGFIVGNRDGGGGALMKPRRVLLLIVGLLPVGFIAFTGDLSGSITASLRIFPIPKISEGKLTLSATVAGWNLSLISDWTDNVWTSQQLSLSGTVSSVRVEAGVEFVVRDVAYGKAWTTCELPLSGEESYLRVEARHWGSVTAYDDEDLEAYGPLPCAVVDTALLPWYEKKGLYEGKVLYVEAYTYTVSLIAPDYYIIYAPAGYAGQHFEIHIMGEALKALEEKYGPISTWPVGSWRPVCVWGEIVTFLAPSWYRNYDSPGIVLSDAADAERLRFGKCPMGASSQGIGSLLNYRGEFVWPPITITVDLFDCCGGTFFKGVEVTLSDVAGCGGTTWEAGFTLTKYNGFEAGYVLLEGLELPCCGISLNLRAEFTAEGKGVAVEPEWGDLAAGCVGIYGDVVWNEGTIEEWELYGFELECAFDAVELRNITACDPAKMEELTGITFREGEFEYLQLTYDAGGCCGRDLTFSSGLWFGNAGALFGVQRVYLGLGLPISGGFSATVEAQWDLSGTPPLEFLDIVWKLEF